jgi:hypothetical protein
MVDRFGEKEAHKFVEMLEQLLKLPTGTFSNVRYTLSRLIIERQIILSDSHLLQT